MMRRRAAFMCVVAMLGLSCGSADPIPDVGPSRIGPDTSPSSPSTSSPSTQRRVSGLVKDTASEPVAGAQVSIAGTALRTTTDSAGRFDLKGDMDADATVQVSKDGFIPQTRQARWTACASTDAPPCLSASLGIIVLRNVASPVDLTGEYSLTISADATCVDLPVEARSRTYSASIAPDAMDNTSIEVRITGASLYADNGDTFYGGVAGDRFVLTLEGSWVHQAFMEEVAPNQYVGFNGKAAGTTTPGATTLSTVLDGTITACRTTLALSEPFYECKSAWPGAPSPPPVSFAACTSKNHRMVFTRR
jgi:hypothetical protein